MRGTNLFSRGARGLVATAVVAASITTGALVTPSTAARAAGPEALILTGPSDRTADPDVTLTFESSAPRATYSTRLDRGRWSPWHRTPSADYPHLAAGKHVVEVRAKSPAGAVGPVERAPFRVDLTDPQTSFTGQKKAATVLDPSTAITFGSTKSGSSYRCKVDTGAYRTCTSPYVVGGMGEGRHELSVEATDSAGNVDATPAARTLVVDQAAAAGTLFSDGFETGNLSRWTVTKAGTGTAVAQTAVVRTGTYAAQFSTTADAGSRAYARSTLTAAVDDLTSVAAVRVDTEGASGGSVPLLRYFGDTGTRTVNLFRANVSGRIWVQYGSTFAATSGSLPLGTWGNVTLRAAGGTLEVQLNGTSVYSTSTAGLAPTRTLQIGNEAAGQSGTLYVDNVSATSTSSDVTPPQTTITSGTSGTVPNGEATFTFRSSEPGSTFQCSLDRAAYTSCASPKAYSGLAKGSHTFKVRAVDAAGNVDPTPSSRAWTAAGDPTPAVMIADNQNRRILVTDYTGKILWSFDNPTGETSAFSGPLGVRLLPNGHILATFGTGTVGEIDMTTKSFVWSVKGYNGAFFQSPYDAELMPDGNIAVANAKANQVVVFNHTTGELVWTYPINFPHYVELLPAGKGLNTTRPTLLTSGFSKLSEVVYAPGQADDKALQYQWGAGSNTHRAILDRDGTSIVLSDWDDFIKLARPTQDITWSRFQGNCCNGEVRGVAMTSNGGYAIGYRIWNGASQIRFTDGQGNQTSLFSALSDGTRLNLPYGVRSLSWPG